MNKKGQIWIETVLYTLIGISLIGVVLAFVTPKITEQKENLMVEQTIKALDAIDQKMNSLLQAPENVRLIDFSMKQGEFHVNSTQDQLVFVIPGLSKPYSEPGVEIQRGRITLITKEKGSKYDVSMHIQYAENITYNLQEENKKFNPASIPYKFSLSNQGVLDENDGRYVISISELSGG